jgi:hypothetical protein
MAAGAGSVMLWSNVRPEGSNNSGKVAVQGALDPGSGSVDAKAKRIGPAFPAFQEGPLSDATFWEAMKKSPEERRSALRSKTAEILASPQLSKRRRWFAAMLENYQSGDLDSVHRGMIDNELKGGRFNEEYEQMMERAAEVDGHRVLNEIQKESGAPGKNTNPWQARCMADWSGSNTDDAVKWWNELPDGHFRDFLSAPLVEGIARTDPARAWAAAQSFEPGQRADFASRLVVAFAKQQGPEASVAWVKSLGPEESQSKARALEELADHMHNMDCKQQAALFAQFTTEPWASNTAAFTTLGTYWAMRDGKQAAAWADALPPQVRQQTLPRVLTRWASIDPNKAGAWVESQRATEDYAAKAQVFLDLLRSRQSGDLQSWQTRLLGN